MSHIKPTSAQFVDLEGYRFNRLVVIGFAGPIPGRSSGYQWSCRCDCGAIVVVRGHNLGNGHTKSCGCLSLETVRQRSLTHGQSRMPEYYAWNTMKARCVNPNDASYHRYGGRGIRVCERYASSYEAFHADMGDRPYPGATIDRRDNMGHYSCGKCPECIANDWPANLDWATRTQQARNRRSTAYLTFDGKTLPVTEWAEITGIAYHSIRYRLAAGWDLSKALTTPTR